jgi:hypothetical protein
MSSSDAPDDRSASSSTSAPPLRGGGASPPRPCAASDARIAFSRSSISRTIASVSGSGSTGSGGSFAGFAGGRSGTSFGAVCARYIERACSFEARSAARGSVNAYTASSSGASGSDTSTSPRHVSFSLRASMSNTAVSSASRTSVSSFPPRFTAKARARRPGSLPSRTGNSGSAPAMEYGSSPVRCGNR